MIAVDVMKSQTPVGYYRYCRLRKCEIGALEPVEHENSFVAGCRSAGGRRRVRHHGIEAGIGCVVFSAGAIGGGKSTAAMNGGLVNGSIGTGLSASEKRSASIVEYGRASNIRRAASLLPERRL